MQTRTFLNYIAGEWKPCRSGKVFPSINPADSTQVISYLQDSSKEDLKEAVAVAQEAFKSWKRTTPPQRAEYLKKVFKSLTERRHEIAKVLILENGKTLRESLAEVDSAIWEMEFQINEGIRAYGETVPSAQSGVFAFTKREPLGVVGIITPWNFPVNVPCRKLTLEEAIKVANGVKFGLSSSIYTKDLSKTMRFIQETEVGLTHINMMTAYKEPTLPFGGVKDSGAGTPEAGKTGIEFFSQHKVVYMKYES